MTVMTFAISAIPDSFLWERRSLLAALPWLVWDELRLEGRRPACGPAAAANCQRPLRELTEAEPLADVAAVDRGRHECTEAELGANEIKRLAQVTRIQEQDAIGPQVLAVLPECPAEPCDENENRAGVREVRLATDEFGRQLLDLISTEQLERLERMVLGAIVVDPRGDSVDVPDEDIRLDRMQAASGRARLLQRCNPGPDLDEPVTAEHLVQDRRQLVERDSGGSIEATYGLAAPERCEDALVATLERQLDSTLGAVDSVEVRRRRAVAVDERRDRFVGLKGQLGWIAEVPPQIDVAPARQGVEQGTVDVPRGGCEVLVPLTKLVQKRIIVAADDEPVLCELRYAAARSRLERVEFAPLVGRQPREKPEIVLRNRHFLAGEDRDPEQPGNSCHRDVARDQAHGVERRRVVPMEERVDGSADLSQRRDWDVRCR